VTSEGNGAVIALMCAMLFLGPAGRKSLVRGGGSDFKPGVKPLTPYTRLTCLGRGDDAARCARCLRWRSKSKRATSGDRSLAPRRRRRARQCAESRMSCKAI